LKALTAMSPWASRAIFSTTLSVSAGMTSGVTLHLATVSPGSTGCESNSVKIEMPSSAFASASA
jgi:hypothetical protein